jgi:transaldolase
MASLLEQLKQYSVVVADTGEVAAIQQFQPQDATTNPSLILKSVLSGKYDHLINEVIQSIGSQNIPLEKKVDAACDHIIVAMGKIILADIPGRISTEVNANLSFNTEASIAKARQLITLYQEAGISTERVLIKLAATWEGIKAAEVLEQEGIQCNLTLIFNFSQARACAEAGIYLISPFVGRILDWHTKNEPSVFYTPENEPGVTSVQSIFNYFRQLNYPTIVMGASFRNSGEILSLAGCDRLTISPALLEELAQTEGSITQQLHAVAGEGKRSSPLTESQFRWQLNEDAMATEKLAEGIRGFEKDQQKLEAILREKFQ